jgi:hypothetical protein
MWMALFHILLEWIGPANCNLHKAEMDLDYDQDDIERPQMIAYANDFSDSHLWSTC